MIAPPMPRRHVLAALAGLPATTIPATSPARAPSLPALWARSEHLLALMNSGTLNERTFDDAFWERHRLDRQVPGTAVAGIADARAALAWARSEFVHFHIEGGAPHPGDLVMLDLLDKVAEALAAAA